MSQWKRSILVFPHLEIQFCVLCPSWKLQGIPTSLPWLLPPPGGTGTQKKNDPHAPAHSLSPPGIPESCHPPHSPLPMSMVTSHSGLPRLPWSGCALPNSGAAYGKKPLGWLSTRLWMGLILYDRSCCLGALSFHGLQCEDVVHPHCGRWAKTAQRLNTGLTGVQHFYSVVFGYSSIEQDIQAQIRKVYTQAKLL